jgi:hypothetical protein
MANSIALVSKAVALLDEVYKQESLTQDLESDSNIVRNGNNANEILYPKLSMDGLADYDRNSGYVDGSATLEWETVKFNYDRGRTFQIDSMDNEETINIAFGRLASEFVRTKVVPELDAVRFATYCGTNNIGTKSESLTSGDDILQAIINANTTMDEAEVPTESRYLYVTPTIYNVVTGLDTYKSREMLDGFAKIVKVPQSRFYSAIDLLYGKSADEEIGGYKKATNGKNINFMVVEKSAVMQFTKHLVNKVITPEMNQSADAWKLFYRAYGLTDVFDNKTAGIYASVSTT